MYCNQCGTELGERETFCPNCGFRVVATAESAQQPPAEPSYEDLPRNVWEKEMKWHNFNVFFALWMWVVNGPLSLLSLIASVLLLRGTNDPIPLIVESVSVIVWLALSWFAGATRKRLVERRSTAPQTLRLFRILFITADFVLTAADTLATSSWGTAVMIVVYELLISAVALTLYLLWEGKYYQKRKHLFVN